MLGQYVFQFNVLSNVNPKNLVLFVVLIILEPWLIDISKLFELLVLIWINLVFS
jgi:hypothetical protein